MRKRTFALLILLLVGSFVEFAMPPGLVNPIYNGDLAGGFIVSLDPFSGKLNFGFEFYYLASDKIGFGFTAMADPDSSDSRSSISVDALYYRDFSSSGTGYVVQPIKVRLGIFAPYGSFGIGLVSGVEYYAFPFAFNTSDLIYVTTNAASSNLFGTVAALGEVDFVRWKYMWQIYPWIEGSISFIGSLGGSGPGNDDYYND
jgi:hypothetical protein